MIGSREMRTMEELSEVSEDLVCDQRAYEAGVCAAVSARTLTLEDAIEQWGPRLLAYLGERGLSARGERLAAAWPAVVGYCDGYAAGIVRRWHRRAARERRAYQRYAFNRLICA